MSIFGTIVNKLFGRAKPNETPPPEAATPASAAQDAAPGTQDIPPVPLTDVDVASIMDQFAAENGQILNWRISIVDVLKALGLDYSLEHRKQLAHELGYDGDTNDSASMNIWLHKAVMKALAANGGKLPDMLAS